jgi:uncharacterized protein
MRLILKIISPPARQHACALLALLAACTGRPSKPDSGVEQRLPDGGALVTRAAVVNAAADCAVLSAKEFRDAATVLKSATATFAPSGDAMAQQAACDAFQLALDVWQVNEVLQFGPAAPSTMPGGNDMRDQIDSWPLVSRCAVEEKLVSKSYESGVSSMLVNQRGLPALEYLLFYEGDDTACGATSPIVAQGTWAAMSSVERATRRRAYAAQVAVDLHARASELVSQWENGFKLSMTTAGTGSALFPTTQAALNTVSHALFYVETSMRDAKLARPLGLRDCATAPCLDQLESPYAGRSKRNIAYNLIGVRRVIMGCETDGSGIGFDDLLVGVGAQTTAQQLEASVAAAQAALTAIDEPDLKDALIADPASVRALYDAMKGITDQLKTDFLTVLDLERPSSLETDND